MMGRTHIAVGVATALVVTHPVTAGACVLGVVGGAIGSVIPDIDMKSSTGYRQALHARLAVLCIVVAAFAYDWLTDAGICKYLYATIGWSRIVGIAAFVLLCFIGSARFGHAKHRGFTHSLFALVLFTGSFALALPTAAPAFAVGFSVHILLDLLNRQDVSVFYPMRKGVSFGLCASDGIVDKVLLAVGTVSSVIIVVCCSGALTL